MFYSARRSAISSDSSHIEFDRIFCGQYWDEYGCVGFLGPADRPSKVLMLGLGDGAAIRPILSSGNVGELTCVDLDESSLAKCREIYDKNFPLLRFLTIRAEALEYLSKTSEQFDVIVVDLYTRESYSPVVFSQIFHDALAACLRPHGHIVCNAYGIPTHLQPFKGKSPQAYLARRFADKWGSLRYLPYRRNVTLIVGQTQSPHTDQDADFGDLKFSDRLALELMSIRLRSMPTVTLDDAPFDLDATRHSEIDAEMRRRWLDLVPEFDSLVTPSFRIRIPSDLVELIHDRELCTALQIKLTAADHEFTPVLPILVAGEFNNRDIDASWLLEWAENYLANPQALGIERFINFCLPQVFSIVINGKNRHRSSVFKFKERIDALSRAFQA